MNLGIAYPASSYAPRDVANAIIKFQKTFDEAPFFATGVMDLPRGGEKATKPSKHNVMTFVILEGAVEATVHQTSFRLKRGSHFIVPRGIIFMFILFYTFNTFRKLLFYTKYCK